MKGEQNLEQILHSLKGAPADIFLALAVHRGPQTVKMLSRHSRYSERTARQAVVRLKEVGLVSYDPDLRAWSLVPDSPFLTVLRQELFGKTAVCPPADKLSTELSTAPAVTAENSAGEPDFSAAGQEMSCADQDPGHDMQTAVGITAEDFGEIGEDSNAEVEVFAAKSEKSSNSDRSLTITTTTNSNIKPDQEVVSKQAKASRMRKSRAPADMRQKVLAEWLVRGGIGRKSAKMRELLASDLDLEDVKAHVLERLAWEAGLIPDSPAFSPGLLITKLLAGDPPPLMRCERCLHLPNKVGLCHCDYEMLVQR
jgi:hypothetical protein